MRISFTLFFVALVFVGCDSMKQRNIAIYNKHIAYEEARKLPPEPTLKQKSVDDVSNESIIDRDGLSEEERALINKIRDKEKAKSRRQSQKVFGVFTPKR